MIGIVHFGNSSRSIPMPKIRLIKLHLIYERIAHLIYERIVHLVLTDLFYSTLICQSLNAQRVLGSPHIVETSNILSFIFWTEETNKEHILIPTFVFYDLTVLFFLVNRCLENWSWFHVLVWHFFCFCFFGCLLG